MCHHRGKPHKANTSLAVMGDGIVPGQAGQPVKSTTRVVAGATHAHVPCGQAHVA